MKFTEEQFNKLVKLQEKEYPNNVYSSSKSGYNNIDEALKKYDLELYRFVEDNDLENQVIALMNPATREWAHEQFVEKEKKFVWTSKKPYYEGLYKRLFMTEIGHYVSEVAISREASEHKTIDEHLTETEVRAYGYDPEWFTKEEVK